MWMGYNIPPICFYPIWVGYFSPHPKLLVEEQHILPPLAQIIIGTECLLMYG